MIRFRKHFFSIVRNKRYPAIYRKLTPFFVVAWMNEMGERLGGNSKKEVIYVHI